MKFLLSFTVEGLSPEGCISRLKGEGVPLSFVQKLSRTRLSFCADRKYREKVFTIVNSSCYNIIGEKSFGLYRLFLSLKRRLGAIFGGMAFCAICALSNAVVWKIDVVGSGAYYKGEIVSTLERNGVALGSFYSEDGANTAAKEILSLSDVGFCSVKKVGSIVRVEVRVSDPPTPIVREVLSPVQGRVETLVVWRGTPCVSALEEVEKGQPLVVAEDGENGVLCRAVLSFVLEIALAEKPENTARAEVALYLAEIGGRAIKEETTDGVYRAECEIILGS